MKADYLNNRDIQHILALLTRSNELVFRVMLETGLRLGDVLAMKSELLHRDRFSVIEEKTGKRRRVRLRAELREELLRVAGRLYIFPHRTNWMRHRTRQAVWKDVRRVASLVGVKVHASPHSARKNFAVELFRECGDMERVKRELNHSDIGVTAIYALADTK